MVTGEPFATYCATMFPCGRDALDGHRGPRRPACPGPGRWHVVGWGHAFAVDGPATLPKSGYGVVVLLNASSGLMLDQTGIFYGVRSIVEGTDSTPTGPAAATFNVRTLDTILGLLTVVVVLLGARGIRRAGRWARRRRRQSWTHTVVRTVPHLVALGAALVFPQLAERLVGGREVTWEEAAYGWPALSVFVCVLLAALLGTLAARAWHLLRRTSSGGLPETASPPPPDVMERDHEDAFSA